MPDHDHLLLTLPPVTSAPARARSALRDWLSRLGGPDRAVEDALLVVSEAVSNSVQHAYPAEGGPDDGISVHAAVTADGDGRPELRLTITDRGRWRAPRSSADGRWRGMALIASVAEQVDVDPGPAGTTVTVRIRPRDD